MGRYSATESRQRLDKISTLCEKIVLDAQGYGPGCGPLWNLQSVQRATERSY